MEDLQKKTKRRLKKVLPKTLEVKLEEEIENIKKLAQDAYDDLLGGGVVDPRSLAHPSIYFGIFVEKLNDFKYIEKKGSDIKLHVPDEENFKFDGDLVVLQVVEGVIGNYLELPETELVKVLDSADVSDDVKFELESLPGNTDGDTDPGLRFRLLKKGSPLADQVERALGKRLIDFPYSNFEPVDLFGDSNDYVKENMSKWVQESINKAQKIIKQELG